MKFSTFKHCRWLGSRLLTSSVVYENIGFIAMDVDDPDGTKLAMKIIFK